MGWQKPDNVAGSSAPAIMVGLFVASAGFLFGYDTGSINGILAMSAFREQFSTGYIDTSDNELGISPSQISLIVSILSVGTILGSLVAAPVGDRWGRRRSLMSSVVVFCAGGICQVCASDIPLLLVGRFLAGAGVGTVSVLVPLYQSEMAPKWIRGTLVCAYQLSITAGLLAAAIINIITADINGAAAYRIPLGLQLVWAGILLIGLVIMPETPRYLVKRGEREAASISLSRLRRLDITHPALLEELAEIEANHEYEMSLGPDSYANLITGSPHLGRRTLTGCGLQMLQQMSGVNFIMYYGTTFFNGAHITNPFLISLVMQIVNFVSTLPGLLVVETWGRRKLLMVGAIGMAVCQLLIASFTCVAGDSMPEVASKILIIFLAIYIFFFAVSWGPVPWVVTSEIYPLKIRAMAMSVSTASNWLLNFGIAYSVPYMVGEAPGYADMGSRVFFVWGAFCIVAAFFVWFMVYETSKISLEQIDEMYERVDYAWNSRRFVPTWSFQQMRVLGYSQNNGILSTQQQPPLPPGHQDQPPQYQQQPHDLTVTASHATDSSQADVSDGPPHSTQSQEDKMILQQIAHVSFSY